MRYTQTEKGISAEIRAKVKRAESGDADAARELLRDFVEAVAETRRSRGKNTILFERYMGYFARCFRKILDEGMPANKALNIAKPKHRPRKNLSARDRDLAREVLLLRLKENMTRENAIARVADERGLSESTVQRAFDGPENLAANIEAFMSIGRKPGQVKK